ncbi:uncharacterized protein LY79DRAFT_556702 [Colletotrichum navitas]|uniref:Uncharacterized protein n=1 Tax=Colletotrichum navitas TaxID=681940 RepID=A0AAD8PY46_9PEZI|nr:uncharacterized protein LY79DRAFT_556702 [Colletotrichum navitas]KAK1589689.1 hypothetical protein LY79DRAFT_556702 [Colletotrichum navitas]
MQVFHQEAHYYPVQVFHQEAYHYPVRYFHEANDHPMQVFHQEAHHNPLYHPQEVDHAQDRHLYALPQHHPNSQDLYHCRRRIRLLPASHCLYSACCSCIPYSYAVLQHHGS